MFYYKMCAILVFTCLSFLLVTEGLPASNFPVGSKQNPGTSCKNILEHGGTTTKNYYIMLGGETIQVYCDQNTAGGGWTLVYSYTFTDISHFKLGSNAVTPRPSWPITGDVRLSTTTPLSETDFNAMEFNLWKKFGTEFLLKSNINNWYACFDGDGSLFRMRSGSLKCRLVRNYMEMCGEIVPNELQTQVSRWKSGPNILDNRVMTPRFRSIYYYNTFAHDEAFPTHDPCGLDLVYKINVKTPHGNIFVR